MAHLGRLDCLWAWRVRLQLGLPRAGEVLPYAVRWVDGAPTYTKIRGRFGTRASALDMDGNRVSFTRKPSRFKNSTW